MEPTWLSELEEKIQAAGNELRSVRRENTRLKKKVADLGGSKAAKSRASKKDWDKEKNEIRRRVEGLVKGLERLLES